VELSPEQSLRGDAQREMVNVVVMAVQQQQQITSSP